MGRCIDRSPMHLAGRETAPAHTAQWAAAGPSLAVDEIVRQLAFLERDLKLNKQDVENAGSEWGLSKYESGSVAKKCQQIFSPVNGTLLSKSQL